MSNHSFFLKTTYRWSDVLGIIALAVVYMAFAKIALSFFSTNGVVSIVWPSSGLALAALLLGGKHYWPGVFIGAFAGNVLAGNLIFPSLFIATGNTLEALTGLALLARVRYFDNRLNNASDYLHLVLACAISACVSALVGNGTLLAYHIVTIKTVIPNLIDWWLGDTLGMILVTPLILVWRRWPRDWLIRERRLETVTCFGLAFLFGQAVFLGAFEKLVSPVLGYWMFVFVAWASIRYGRHGTLLLISMILIQGLLGSVARKGAFSAVQNGLFNFTCYVLVMMVVGIGLTLIIKKRQETEHALRLSEQRLLTAQRIAHIGNWEWNVTHDKLFWSDQLFHIFGLEPQRQPINYAIFLKRVHPDDRQAVMDAIDDALDLSHILRLDYRIQLPNGEQRFLYAQAEVDTDTNGHTRMIGTVQDITHRKLTEEALQLSSLVYQNSSEAVMVTDANNIIIAVNPTFTELTGYNEEEVIGKNPSIRKSGHHDTDFYKDLHDALNSNGQWQGEIWNRRKSGEIRAEWLNINTIFHEDGSVYRRVSLFSDITQKKDDEALIWNQANFDKLTNLPNRNMFYDRLEQNLKKAHRHQESLVLLFLDLDRFKEINDSFGHSVGDMLLKEVSIRLVACVRETDTVARLGGDEFTIVLSGLSHINDAEIVAQSIIDELIKPFFINDKTLYISTSIGITVYPDDADNAETLLKNADQAMYAAKAQGRNRYSYFTLAMERAAQTRMQLATDLRTAFKEEQFLVYYQPIVTLATMSIDKAEALIRWQHPVRGMISPAEFIPIAEESGMIIHIGEWVFRQVAQQLVEWRTNYHSDFQISINKSPIQFHSNTGYLSWAEQLKNINLLGQSIVVEITEGMLLDVNDVIRSNLIEYRNANIEVSLDDFGTGYSSLSYLKKFDIDYLKIDQSFVRNLEAESDDLALCEAIIVMAHKLGIKVIAEGIENAEQLHLLVAAGCDYGQGYLFSKPVPPSEFERLFDTPIANKAEVTDDITRLSARYKIPRAKLRKHHANLNALNRVKPPLI